MDGQRFDALARTLTGGGSRRWALTRLLGGALGLAGSLGSQEARTHDNWSRCNNISNREWRKACKQAGKAHRRWHANNLETVCLDSQYTARYWINNSLSGAPSISRCENWPINHNWALGSPGGAIPPDNFSARWTGRSFIAAGVYDFRARGDDGIRVWLNNQLIIDRWSGALPEIRVNATVPANTYDIVVEFREFSGDARAFFRWDRADVCQPIGENCTDVFDCCGPATVICRPDTCYTGNVCCIARNQSCPSGRNCDCCDADLCVNFVCRAPTSRLTADSASKALDTESVDEPEKQRRDSRPRHHDRATRNRSGTQAVPIIINN